MNFPKQVVKPAKTYSVWFRTGGTENFKWQLVGERYANVDLARESAESLRKMGYPAHFARTSEIEAIGLSDSFE